MHEILKRIFPWRPFLSVIWSFVVNGTSIKVFLFFYKLSVLWKGLIFFYFDISAFFQAFLVNSSKPNSWYPLRNLLYGNMLESRMFATSCIVKNSKLVAKARLSSIFPYKRLRNGYHKYRFDSRLLPTSNLWIA